MLLNISNFGTSPNSELGRPKDVKEFIISIIPNNARMASYYTPKPILKMLKNPKYLIYVNHPA
ncbi:MAG: hypothetical protein OXC46_03890 [Thaumarchaeota archaeon]|nr:hypothetical protein [Nitrososphaerota archaeon]